MKVELTVDEINLILKALAKLPFEQVALLIPNIQEQAKQQLDTEQWHQTTT